MSLLWHGAAWRFWLHETNLISRSQLRCNADTEILTNLRADSHRADGFRETIDAARFLFWICPHLRVDCKCLTTMLGWAELESCNFFRQMLMCKEISANGRQAAPAISEFANWRSSDLLGALFLIFGLSLTGLAVFLSSSEQTSIWLTGQILVAVAFVQWFAILHEAGHKTLFRTQALNHVAGHLAGFFAGFPFPTWKLIHALHHRWTGWQDLDATTAGLTPRKRSKWLLLAVRICWACWIPIFSVIYRVDNYWNLPRLHRLFSHKRNVWRLVVSIAAVMVLYAALIYIVGPVQLLRLLGLGVLLGLMVEDLLILSQHTHIPMQVSDGESVDPVPSLQQEVFTRSLRFPAWFSQLVLLNLDAHELHHMYVQVPGYFLRRIDYVPQNEIAWWKWVLKSKSVPGDVLLFQNREQTGWEF